METAAQRTPIDPQFKEMLNILHAGGEWAYWWNRDPKTNKKVSEWWQTANPTAPTNGVVDAYFGVHPVVQIPATNQHGESVPPHAVRSQIKYIAAVNALFGEYDAKDYSSKADALTAVESVNPAASIIIDSGGGYHAYWLLDGTWELTTDADREKAKDIQARWVEYVGADTASKDLARVLRVPGTHNLKYEDKPIVSFVKYDIGLLYDLDELIALLPKPQAQPLNYDAAPAVDTIDDRRLAAYLDRALREEIANVALAGDGLKHPTLRDAAVKVGSLIPHGLNEEAAFNGLYNAISGRAKDLKNAADTIRDGLEYGKKSPRDISKLASLEPGFDSDGVPHCPQCGDMLFYAASKDIWGCKECINASKPYWWRGNGYVPQPTVEGFVESEAIPQHTPAELSDEVPSLPFEIDFTQGQGAGRWLDLYVNYASQVSPMTPRMFHETAALWLVSVGIARRLRVKMNFANIYPNLFILWMARSTVWGKSTAMDIAVETANRVFSHLLSPHDITPEAMLADMSGKEPRNFKELSDEALQMWRAERNFCAQRGLAIDEISGFLAKAQKDYNAGLIEAFLKFYDCADHKGSTKSEGRIWVRNTYVSILGASTPVMMAQHFKNAQLAANGWWYRFIIATPEVDKPEYKENPEHISEPPYLHTWLHSIYGRLPQASYPIPVEPITLTLDADVMALWKQFDKAMRYDLQEGDFDERFASAYGRMPTLAIKVATILAAMDWGENMPQPIVKYRHMVRAIEMCEQWRRSLHRAMGASTASSEKALRDRILRQVARFDEQGGIKMADLSNLMKDVEYAQLKAAVIECIELQHIEEMVVPTGGKGRPSKKYRLPR